MNFTFYAPILMLVVLAIGYAGICYPYKTKKPVTSPSITTMQPVYVDHQGVTRFKENKIVSALYREAANRGIGMNAIAKGNFSDEDRMQFAQLIGYSVNGYCDLSYTSDKSCAEATRRSDAALKERA